MKAAVRQEALACSPQSQATLERKAEQVVRTRSQVAKALLLERNVEGASSGPLASQSGTAEAPSPMQPREIQQEPMQPQEIQQEASACSPQSQATLERKAEQVMQKRSQVAKATSLERNVEGASKGPLSSQSGTAEAPSPMQPQKIQREALTCSPQSQATPERKMEQVMQKRHQVAKATSLERNVEGASKGLLASQSGTAEAPSPMQPQKFQREALTCSPQSQATPERKAERSQVAKAISLEQNVEGASKGPLASQSGTAEAPSPMQPQKFQREALTCSPQSQATPERKMEQVMQKRSQVAKATSLERNVEGASKGPLASQSGTAEAPSPMQPQKFQREALTCSPQSQATPEHKAERSQVAKAISLEQNVEGASKGPLASQSGTAEAPSPMQSQNIQREALTCSPQSQATPERKMEQVMQKRHQVAKATSLERNVEGASKGPLASQPGTSEALPPMQPQEIWPEPEVRPILGWQTEFQEFLEAEKATREEQLLMEPNPWANTAAFLASFEQVALACQWPRREWVTRLLPALSEDAEKAFIRMKAKDRGDFQKVKAAILRREALCRERKRQAFRRFCYQEANGPGEVCARLQELCHRWLKVEQSTKEQILDLLILEQFMNVLPKEMLNWVKERGPDTCVQAVALAEDFLQRLEAVDLGTEQEPEAVAGSPPQRGGTQLEVAPTQMQVEWDVKGNSGALQRTYPAGYRKARASTKKKNVQWRQCEDTKLRARFPVRANTVFPKPLKQEGAAEDPRRSERLRKSRPAPVHEEPSSPPRKVCKKVEKPSPPQGPLPDLKKTCAVCGQHFNGLASFMRHNIIHTGEKRYECCFCGKGFCWRSDLVRHECIHTGKMPHECTYCGQGFDRKWKRKQHEEEHLKSKALI